MLLTRRALMAGAAALPLSACVSVRTGSAPKDLRVLTFNIWHDRDWPARRPLLTEAMRGADADIIALQEVLQDASKELPNQADMLRGSGLELLGSGIGSVAVKELLAGAGELLVAAPAAGFAPLFRSMPLEQVADVWNGDPAVRYIIQPNPV